MENWNSAQAVVTELYYRLSGCLCFKKVAATQTLSQFTRFALCPNTSSPSSWLIKRLLSSSYLGWSLLMLGAQPSPWGCLLHHGNSLWLYLGWHPQLPGFHLFPFLDVFQHFGGPSPPVAFWERMHRRQLYETLHVREVFFLRSHLTDRLAGYRILNWITFP